MRVQLAELQRRYKEKQRELARLQRRHDHEYGPGWQWGGGGGRECGLCRHPQFRAEAGTAQPRAIALWPGVNLCVLG